MGNTDAVVDVLADESIHIDYEDMEIMLMGLKQGGTDACAVVDEQEFKFAINDMIAQATAVDPLTTFTKERWDRVFNDMVGHASGRLPAGPSHFTAAEEYVRRQTELQERDIHAATHHGQGGRTSRIQYQGPFDVYHPVVGPGHYTDDERAALDLVHEEHMRSHHTGQRPVGFLPARPHGRPRGRPRVRPGQQRREWAEDATRANIIQFATDNPMASILDIAARFGIAGQTVRKIMAEAGVPTQRKHPQIVERNALIVQYAIDHPELTGRAIARDLADQGILTRTSADDPYSSARQQVARAMRAAGMPLRDPMRRPRQTSQARRGIPPAHYTDETPEGALEAMERRLQEVLATMDLRVGELAEAIRQMGATGIPVPVVEAIEDAVEAITVAAEEATDEVQTEGVVSHPLSSPRGRAIRSYLQELGTVEVAKLDARDVRRAVMEKHPELGEISLKDITNAMRPLVRLGYKLKPLPRAGGVPAPVKETLPLQGSKARMIADYLLQLGADAGTTNMATFLEGVRLQIPALPLLIWTTMQS